MDLPTAETARAVSAPNECPFGAVSKKPGMHSFIITYRRPWQLCWRKVYAIRCWECELDIREPVFVINDWERRPRRG